MSLQVAQIWAVVLGGIGYLCMLFGRRWGWWQWLGTMLLGFLVGYLFPGESSEIASPPIVFLLSANLAALGLPLGRRKGISRWLSWALALWGLVGILIVAARLAMVFACAGFLLTVILSLRAGTGARVTSPDAPPSWRERLLFTISMLLYIAVSLGGTAFHLWTAITWYKSRGFVAALIAFVTPPFSWLVTIGASFHQGGLLNTYILGFTSLALAYGLATVAADARFDIGLSSRDPATALPSSGDGL